MVSTPCPRSHMPMSPCTPPCMVHCMALHGTAWAVPAWATHGMLTQLACMCPKFWQHLAGTYYTHMSCHTSPLHTCVTRGAPPCPMFQPPHTPNLGPKYLHACNPHQGISEYVWQGISQGVRGWSYMFEKLNKKVCSNGVKSTPPCKSACIHTCACYPAATSLSARSLCLSVCRLE